VDAVGAVEAVGARPTVGAAGPVDAVPPTVAVVAVVAVDAVGAVGAVAAVGAVGMPWPPAAWPQAPDSVRAARSATVARLSLTGFAEPFTGGLSMSNLRVPEDQYRGCSRPALNLDVSGRMGVAHRRSTIRLPAPCRR